VLTLPQGIVIQGRNITVAELGVICDPMAVDPHAGGEIET